MNSLLLVNLIELVLFPVLLPVVLRWGRWGFLFKHTNKLFHFMQLVGMLSFFGVTAPVAVYGIFVVMLNLGVEIPIFRLVCFIKNTFRKLVGKEEIPLIELNWSIGGNFFKNYFEKLVAEYEEIFDVFSQKELDNLDISFLQLDKAFGRAYEWHDYIRYHLIRWTCDWIAVIILLGVWK